MKGKRMRTVLLALMLSTGACLAQTPSVCPWLSTGSAADILGGPVEPDLHIDNSSQGSCRFIRGSGTEQGVIEIIIGKADTHACTAGSTKIVGLGNEAVECKKTNAGGHDTDRIAGRVRDVYFVVDVSPATMHLRDPANPSALERVAEQVVGNLY
jgi:hypothetical protein